MRKVKARDTAWSGGSKARGDKLSRAFEWAVGFLWILLLWTWIKPIADMSEWTEPDKTVPLFAIIAFYVLADMLRIPAALGVPLKGAATVLTIGWLFRDSGGHSGFGMDWLKAYSAISAEDVRAVAAAKWEEISPENRTMIFLAGWAMLASVIQSILVYRKRGFWLVSATWAYLLGLQLWPGLSTVRELIAAGAAGLLLLAALHMRRIREKYATGLLRVKPAIADAAAEAGAAGGAGGGAGVGPESKPLNHSARWIAGENPHGGENVTASPPGLFAASLLVTFILFVSALSGAGSKGAMEPLQSDTWERVADVFRPDDYGEQSIPRETNLALGRGGAVTGYGSDDSQLGGPLSVRDEPVFTARTPVQTYWRGEAKDYYDGQGWSASPDGYPAAEWGQAVAVNLPVNSTVTQTDIPTITQEILYQGSKSLNMLFAGGEIKNIQGLFTLAGQSIPVSALASDPETGRYSLLSNRWGQLEYARVEVRLPVTQPEELIAARGEAPEELRRAYLQLPDGLPERVKILALETAAAGQTPYAKAVLIERYLKENYTYSLTEVPVPEKGRDFVDTFLFEGSSGYCDYFSTAMVVMLRSAGVPARWVKGFAPGEAVSADGMWTVQVSSKDAHSWVEAYIPGAGWVPFDPTPGFGGFTAPEDAAPYELLLQQGLTDSALSAEEAGGLDSEPLFGWSGSDLKEAWSDTAAVLADASKNLWRQSEPYRIPAAALMLAIIPLLYLIRNKWQWMAMLLLLRFRKRGSGRSALAVKLLDRLWLRVYRLYGHKPPQETFREYAEKVGAANPGVRDALFELVRLYENVRYGEGLSPWLPGRRLSGLWRHLLEGKASGGSRGLPM